MDENPYPVNKHTVDDFQQGDVVRIRRAKANVGNDWYYDERGTICVVVKKNSTFVYLLPIAPPHAVQKLQKYINKIDGGGFYPSSLEKNEEPIREIND